MRAPILPPAPSLVCIRKNSIDVEDDQHDDQPLQDGQLGTTDKLLLEIRDLLRTKIRRKAEKRDEAEDEEDKKTDYWMFAADVIDRILLIIFTVLFIGGTSCFAIMAAVYHSHI